MSLTVRIAAGVLTLALSAAPLLAQTTRVEVLEQERAAKATDLREYTPGRLEKWLLRGEQNDLFARLAPRNGFFVRYGFPEKPVGAGIGLGGGYRHDLFDRRARVVAEAGFSLRRYSLLRADVSLPYLARERAEVGVEVSRRQNPQEEFFGDGPDSLEADRTNFRLDTTAAIGRALVKPRTWLSAGVHAGRVAPSVGSGTDSLYPSSELRFGEEVLVGFSEQPDFRYTDAFATIDYRDHSGNARAGGYYSVVLGSYADLDADRYSFRRLDLHGQQFFPIFDKKRVFALQGRVITTSTDEGQVVPFYFQPTLGGSTTLRSVSDFRFRDDNLLYLNAEYRWEAFSAMDMALFADFGKVAPDAGDLDLTDLTHAYGIGLRFNTYKSVFLRLDVATGAGEGLQYFLKFSKAF
ncbi:MAG: BamA/TamA family outer membrane protein [Vicinamibacterales bacterium]